MTIDEALARYETQLSADGRSLHTKEQVRRHVGMLARWLASSGHPADVDAVRHELIARFLASDVVQRRVDGRPRKPGSANAIRSSLRTFFGFVHAAGYVPLNAAALVRRARCGAPPPRALSDDDRDRLLAALATVSTEAERRDRALFATLLTAGLRIGSALAADVEDLDPVAGELRLRHMKNATEDVVYLPAETVTLLADHLAGRASGPLFPAEDGGRLGARQAHRRLALWARRAGIARTISPHALRHTFATRVYRRTGDLLVTARALCHRSIASTAMYARTDHQHLRSIVGSN